jgi:hypothetical protein
MIVIWLRLLSGCGETIAHLVRDTTEPFALRGCTVAFSIGALVVAPVLGGFSGDGLPIGFLISGRLSRNPASAR